MQPSFLKPPRHSSDKIQRAEQILSAFDAVISRAPAGERHELRALRARITLCNSLKNQWSTPDAVNFSTGEVYEAAGRFWRCGSKLCPSCLARQSQINRKHLREVITQQKLAKGERYYFITLTITNPSQPLLATRKLVDRAWVLFRKRSLCVSSFRGGSKSEEFTVTENGYHYHLHLLIRSKWLYYKEIRRVWTECVAKAFDDANLPFNVDTNDGLLWIKIKPVTPNDGLYHELCKYVTKSDSWLKMPVQHIAEIALVRRWNRMFEVFGTFANRTPIADSSDESPIVHKRSLSDEASSAVPKYWRDKIVSMNLDAYESELEDEFHKVRRARLQQIAHRWPDAKVIEYD